jgi:hypothetical protein
MEVRSIIRMCAGGLRFLTCTYCKVCLDNVLEPLGELGLAVSFCETEKGRFGEEEPALGIYLGRWSAKVTLGYGTVLHCLLSRGIIARDVDNTEPSICGRQIYFDF